MWSCLLVCDNVWFSCQYAIICQYVIMFVNVWWCLSIPLLSHTDKHYQMLKNMITYWKKYYMFQSMTIELNVVNTMWTSSSSCRMSFLLVMLLLTFKTMQIYVDIVITNVQNDANLCRYCNYQHSKRCKFMPIL
jgi:hypothetical protein